MRRHDELLGMSQGSLLSATFAATYPQRCSELVLYGGWGRTIGGPDYPGMPGSTYVELPGADHLWFTGRRGARVGALAGPGEILVSRTVRDLVAGSGIEFSDRGAHELKGVPGSWELPAVESA